ncbi:MAG: nicotinate-nucleotide--dimethylbenzimidazole phosphoribosyltransferase [Nitrospinota bacterium]
MRESTDVSRTIALIGPPDEEAARAVRKRLDSLTKPQGSLGLIEDLLVGLAAAQGSAPPRVERKVILTFAADHGVAEEGVSAYPKEVTAQMVYNFLRGGACINVLARAAGAEIKVVDMGVEHDLSGEASLKHLAIGPGTKNMALGPAMSREEAERALSAGIGLARSCAGEGFQLMGVGDMGIANTTSASAITAALTGRPVKEVVGAGTGVQGEALAKKVATVERALRVNKPDGRDGLDVLSKVGGFEIGGIAGAILGAAAHRVPVLLDGFVTGAAALIALSLAPHARPFIFPSHLSAEPGHGAQLQTLSHKAPLNMQMRLGEGTGAALYMLLLEAGVKVLEEMATFGEAGVSEKL